MKKRTIAEKKEFIEIWADRMDELWNIYPNEAEEYKAVIEEGIEKAWPEALKAKGYACYGGNAIYPCDWDESKRCIERLAELTEDPYCYNTLGYIYYYGRCNGGVPQYDEAFKCFSVGHACGIFESTYKLADMFQNGYGIPKNSKATFELISRIYDENLEIFCGEHFEGKFADVALRLGNLFEQGIGVEKSVINAYVLFLQAKYAIDMRTSHYDFYGDQKVKAAIEKALKRAEKKIDPDHFLDEINIGVPGPIGDILSCSAAIEINLKAKGKQYYLEAKGIPDENGEGGRALITLSEFKSCKLYDKAELRLIKPELISRDMSEKLYATSIHYNNEDDTWEFCDGERIVLKFRCEGFVFSR